jgi:hypothetical protein
MEFKGFNLNAFVKEHGIMIIMQDTNTKHKIYNVKTSVT